MSRRIAAARETIEHAFALWRQHLAERESGRHSAWRTTRRRSRLRLKEARRQWRSALDLLDQRQAA